MAGTETVVMTFAWYSHATNIRQTTCLPTVLAPAHELEVLMQNEVCHALHLYLQDAPELLVGLRTGFCGSLTTFASWELSLVTLLIGGRGIQGGQWAEFLWGLIIGFQLALSSYMFGVHLAANLAAFFTAAGSSKGPREQENRQQRPEEKPALGDKPGESRGSGGVSSQQSGQTPGSAGWDVEERGQLGAGIFRAAGRSDGQDRTETETKSPLQSKLSPHYRKAGTTP